MGARDPQQAQEANNRNLADEGKAINYEGDTPAHQGCLDQIGDSHTTVCALLAESGGGALSGGSLRRFQPFAEG
jgi:hypothetical protein